MPEWNTSLFCCQIHGCPFGTVFREGHVLDTIAVVFIVCLAAGYLVLRYVKRNKNTGGCTCENMECPLKSAGSVTMENPCEGMVCESKKAKP